jgi:hypothetical protein
MKAAKNASSRLKGSAKFKILKRMTPIFPTTIHIRINPANQEMKVVCNRENFRDMI